MYSQSGAQKELEEPQQAEDPAATTPETHLEPEEQQPVDDPTSCSAPKPDTFELRGDAKKTNGDVECESASQQDKCKKKKKKAMSNMTEKASSDTDEITCALAELDMKESNKKGEKKAGSNMAENNNGIQTSPEHTTTLSDEHQNAISWIKATKREIIGLPWREIIQIQAPKTEVSVNTTLDIALTAYQTRNRLRMEQQAIEKQSTEDQSLHEQATEDLPLEDHPLEDQPLNERVVEDQPFDERASEDPPSEDHIQKDQPLDERVMEDQIPQDHLPEDHPSEDNRLEDQPFDERATKDPPPEDHPLEDQPLDERVIEDQRPECHPLEDNPPEGQPVEGRVMEDQLPEDQPPEDYPLEDYPPEDCPPEDYPTEENPQEYQVQDHQLLDGPVTDEQAMGESTKSQSTFFYKVIFGRTDERKRIASQYLPEHITSYMNKAAGTRETSQKNREAFKKWSIVPRCLVGIRKKPDLTTKVLKETLQFPIAIAPMGVQEMLYRGGEDATAKACAKERVPYIMSTNSSDSIEFLAYANGADGQRWFQLYWPDHHQHDKRRIAISLLQRAKNAGFTALFVTLDNYTDGWRPELFGMHAYPVGLGPGLSDPVFQEIFKKYYGIKAEEDIHTAAQEWAKVIFPGASHTWEDVKFLQEHWDGPIVLKGIQTIEDAKHAVKAGVQGIVVSNHGGCHQDGGPSSLGMLPHIVGAVGNELDVFFDSGVRCGADIAKALALGAKCVLIGRQYLYGLVLGGEEGVSFVLRYLANELASTLYLAGIPSVQQEHLNRSVLVREDELFSSVKGVGIH